MNTVHIQLPVDKTDIESPSPSDLSTCESEAFPVLVEEQTPKTNRIKAIIAIQIMAFSVPATGTLFRMAGDEGADVGK